MFSGERDRDLERDLERDLDLEPAERERDLDLEPAFLSPFFSLSADLDLRSLLPDLDRDLDLLRDLDLESLWDRERRERLRERRDRERDLDFLRRLRDLERERLREFDWLLEHARHKPKNTY